MLKSIFPSILIFLLFGLIYFIIFNQKLLPAPYIVQLLATSFSLLAVNSFITIFLKKAALSKEKSLIGFVLFSLVFTIFYFTIFIIFYLTYETFEATELVLLLSNYAFFKGTLIYQLSKIK